MTEGELLELLERHESLVASCIAGELSVEEFVERYEDFPHAYALDGHEGDEAFQILLRRHSERVRFHFGVLETLAGLCSERDARSPKYQRAGRFGPIEGLNRLRKFVQQNSPWRNQ